jgi:hypothetical protein
MKQHLTSLIALYALGGSVDAAAVVYHDATVTGMSGTANTVATSGTLGPGADAATHFRIRGLNGGTDTVNFSNFGSAIQNVANPVSATPPTLRTTITGLDPAKTYEVFVFYWDDVSATNVTTKPTAATAWDISAKLSTVSTYTNFSSDLGTYLVTRNDGTIDGNNFSASANGYTAIPFNDITGLNVLGQGADTYVDAVDNNRAMFGGLLTSTFTGSATLSVDIQPSASTVGRTWYDGIGLRDVTPVPEPTAAALLLGGLMAGVRRRRC